MANHLVTHFTSEIIKKETTCSLKEIKKIIIKADKKMTIKYNKEMTIKKCGEKPPMIAKVAESSGWATLWEHILYLGWKTVQGLKMLSRAIGHHGKGHSTMSPVIQNRVLYPRVGVLEFSPSSLNFPPPGNLKVCIVSLFTYGHKNLTSHHRIMHTTLS